jgi:hypothetical protein
MNQGSEFVDLSQGTEDVPRRFIFNVDEMEWSNFGDQRELTVFLPYACDANPVPVLVNRHTSSDSHDVYRGGRLPHAPVRDRRRAHHQ